MRRGDEEHVALGTTEKIDHFLANERPALPCVVMDRDEMHSRYSSLCAAFPNARIFYAVKANPMPEVLSALMAAGANFDLASAGEGERCLKLGITPDRLSFGNIVKRTQDIAQAYRNGVDRFAFDSSAELEKIAHAAPGAQVFCRLLVDGKGADWPLTRKFGCDEEMAVDLLLQTRALGLSPTGVSFHVGSQQTDPSQWHAPIAMASRVFERCAARGLDLAFVNVGGGLPAQYQTAIPSLDAFAEAIEAALTQYFGSSRPQIVIEPGRYLVGDAGVLRSEILLIAKKSRRATTRWIYLDAGRYNGLPETQGERIRYRIRTPQRGSRRGHVIIAGPTCDSTDIIYEHSGYELPLDLEVGDPIDFLSAGAYTASYASVEFNGFAPIRTYCI
jgi:ornithine decarboxylase